MSETSTAPSNPTTTEEWVERIEEMMEEMADSTVVQDAYAGNATARATVEAWAVELQAALMYLSTVSSLSYISQEIMLEMINEVIDTLQAILLALGIIYLINKLRVRDERTRTVVDINISESQARRDLGDRIKPVPSRRDDAEQNREWESEFLRLRFEWTVYYILTMLKAARMREEEDIDPDAELVWRSHKDGKTCSICLSMDGERSEGGDFMPVLIRKFPDYRTYGPFMIWPHAHPRCRCWAEVA